MTPPPRPETAVTALKRLLESVNSALRSGDFSTLGNLATAQDKAITSLLSGAGKNSLPVSSDTRTLLRLAEINRRMLEATMRGIKSARRRRREIESASGSTLTYSNSGKRIALEPKASAFERRK